MVVSQKKLTIVHFAADWWEHVCPTLRVSIPAQRAGLDVIHGNEWEDGTTRVFPERVAQGDIVVVQRDFPRYAEKYAQVVDQAHSLGKPIVYELDDLLTELPDQHPDAEYYKIARAASLQAAVEADLVTTTTAPLRDYLQSFNPNVRLLPNYLIDSLWHFAEPVSFDVQQQRPIAIGYLGSHGHVFDLEMIVPALVRLAQQYGDQIVFKFWGITPPEPLMQIAQVESFWPGLVDYAKFADYFSQQKCDIFIAPLQNNLFNRCKSSLKFLEYSTLGVPGVYSNIEPYASVVEHSKNGFLATTLEEWEDCLSRLIESVDLRREIGLATQRTVKENWLLADHGMEWEQVYRAAIRTARDSRLSTAVNVAREMNRWHRELTTELAKREQTVQKLTVEKDQLDQILGKQISDRDEQLANISSQLAEKEQSVKLLESSLAEKNLLAQTLNERLQETEHSVQLLRTELANIKSSVGWEWLQVAWRLRMRLVPRGGLRERFLSLFIRGARVWRREGFRSLTDKASRKGVNKLLRRNVQPTVVTPSPLITFRAEPGSQCPQPAVSLLIPKEDETSSQLIDSIKEWSARQTWHSVEAIVWDRHSCTAWKMNDPSIHWDARDIESLCSQAQGRYVCIASSDLLSQSETYLEANLVALESESLAFTVNLNGKVDWAIDLIQSNKLPLSRQIVRKECLRNDGSLDLSAWVVQRQSPMVVAKIITHTTNRFDKQDAMRFESKVTGAELLVSGHHILARSNAQVSWATTHILHPVDTVLLRQVERSELPTILVVMPFLAVGGAERVLLDVMRCLKKEIRFVVVTLEPFDTSLGTMADEFRCVTPYIYTVPDYLEMPLNFSIMCYLIERFQPHTLYIANGTTWIYNALATLKQFFPKIRVVNQVYDHQIGWINRYDSTLAQTIDGHIASNKNICEAYIARGADPRQVYFLWNGIDPQVTDPANYSDDRRKQIIEKLGLPQGRRVISFISRLHPQKRPMDFVELARRFSSDPTLVFLLVGDGPLGDVVNREVNRIGLKNLVKHPIYRPSNDLIAISDLIVLPSEYEGMSMIVLEAVAMGKPVVATDVGNNREILELTQGGRVVSSIGDVGKLSEAVTQVLQSEFDSARVRQTTLEHFSLQKIAAEYRRALFGD